MFGFLNIKVLLLGVVFATPLAVTWVWRGGDAPARPVQGVRTIGTTSEVIPQPTVRMPVEVVAKGSAPKWVYVEVAPPESVPEPGVLPLVLVPALALVIRRRREK